MDQPFRVPSWLETVQELHEEDSELVVLGAEVLTIFLNSEEKLELVEEILEEVVNVYLLYRVFRQFLDEPKVILRFKSEEGVVLPVVLEEVFNLSDQVF